MRNKTCFSVLRCLLLALMLLPGLVLADQPMTLHTSDGVDVYGTLTHAKSNAHSTRIILLFHQAGANRHEYDAVVPKLTTLGFDTLAIDQRSGGNLFGGHNETVQNLGKSADYLDAVSDLEAALAWAQSHHYGTIVTVGSSYSSALVIMLAARHPKAISAVASFSPGEYFDDKNLIKNAAAKVRIPFYITTDPKEEKNVTEVLRKAHGDNITRYRPKVGVHGASTLVCARDARGCKANMRSFTRFLKSVIDSASGEAVEI